ncbi:uridine kinase family protein [Tsukamurella soli]|uniref:Uridine kinase n=1 Tax=Tsukamurella soli TaxID=644556 RepID=A0ABP8J7S7_9ACTN
MRADEVLARLGGARGIVTVDGPSGAGKSTYAAALVDDLSAAGHRVALVRTDDYATWDNPAAWWPRMLREIIDPFARGWDARYRPMQWRDGVPRPGPETRMSWAPLVVLEGVSSGRRSFASRTDLALWLDGGDPAARLERAVARDGESEREHLRAWQEWERGWFEVDRTRERCTVVEA